MSNQQLRPLLESVLKELNSTLNQWLKEKDIVGHIFQVPVKTSGGWQAGPESLQEVVPAWFSTLELIYGRKLENLKLLPDLQQELSKYYESKLAPPRWSTGPDLTHEIKGLMSDFMSASKLNGRSVEFPSDGSPIERACDFFTRDYDIYLAKSPLLGLRTQEEIIFSSGKLSPLSWQDRVNLLKGRSGDQSLGYTGKIHLDRVLNSEALLQVSFKRQRRSGENIMSPQEVQNLSDNAVQLLRVYDYGPVQCLWTEISLESITKRGCGIISSAADNTFSSTSEFYTIEESQCFKSFIEKFLKSDRVEYGELTFILNRLNEAWLKGRTINFRVFDYVSILEALLVASNEGEFKFRVSALAAAFSSSDTTKKRSLFKLVKKAYDVRSKVAHCAKDISAKDQLTPDELKTLGGITHAIIRYALEHGPTSLKSEAVDKLLS